jgi:tRNA(Arg) A34 adenosine deaminase TadA
LEKGEMPFGACVVGNGQVVSIAHNSAKADTDMIAHAEVQAIREASRRVNALELTGGTVYSTCEPRPMGFTACVWAKAERIVYACRIEDAAQCLSKDEATSNRQSAPQYSRTSTAG